MSQGHFEIPKGRLPCDDGLYIRLIPSCRGGDLCEFGDLFWSCWHYAVWVMGTNSFFGYPRYPIEISWRLSSTMGVLFSSTSMSWIVRGFSQLFLGVGRGIAVIGRKKAPCKTEDSLNKHYRARWCHYCDQYAVIICNLSVLSSVWAIHK